MWGTALATVCMAILSPRGGARGKHNMCPELRLADFGATILEDRPAGASGFVHHIISSMSFTASLHHLQTCSSLQHSSQANGLLLLP